MSKHWLTIVLFISLAFNLAVMIMFSYAQIYHKPPFFHPPIGHNMDRKHNRKRDANLPPAMKQLMEKNKADMEIYREDFAKKRVEFMQTLAKDTLNVKKAEAAMDASLKSHEVLERKLGTSLIDLRKQMTPIEAKAFFKERMERRMHKFDRFHSKHQRFNKHINKQGDSL